MQQELRTGRLVMMIEPSLIRRIDDWRRARGIDSRAEGMRQLVGIGLAVEAAMVAGIVDEKSNESPAGIALPPGRDLTVNPGKDESEDERE